MSFLTLSGIPLPAVRLRRTPTLLGAKVRAFSGFPASSVRKKLMTYSGGTPPLPLTEAAALRALVDGEGHSWDFADDNLSSSRGLAPHLVSGGVETGVMEGPFADGALSFTSGQGDQARWYVGAHEEWTVMAWRFSGSGIGSGPWQHWVSRNANGTVSHFMNGTAIAAVESLAPVLSTAGELTLLFANYPAPESWAGLVFLPYAVPDAWPAHVFSAGAAFGPLPYHRASGTGLLRPVRVLGDAKEGESLEFWSGTARVPGEAFDFELLEAP